MAICYREFTRVHVFMTTMYVEGEIMENPTKARTTLFFLKPSFTLETSNET